MNFIKRALFRIFNERIYFSMVSKFFFIFYYSGLLKAFEKFKMHYFVPGLIRTGDTVIDIGANLGYYTSIFSRATGKDGIVWAVEPIPLYQEILKRNTRKSSNIIILPYALGDKEREAEMGIPGNDQYRHGLTRIVSIDEQGQNETTGVEVKTPEGLFGNIERVDYIKCDIEGYEDKVLPGFIEIIRRDKPVIQIEIDPANMKVINDLLTGEGYSSYIPSEKGLKKIAASAGYNEDILYIHVHRHDRIETFINNHIT